MTTARKSTVLNDLHNLFNGRNYKGLLRDYRNWLTGHDDRISGKPCSSVNGHYLDGWYSPERSFPDFLTPTQFATILRRIQVGEWQVFNKHEYRWI